LTEASRAVLGPLVGFSPVFLARLGAQAADDGREAALVIWLANAVFLAVALSALGIRRRRVGGAQRAARAT
jgi:hypothetical protein